MPRPRVRRARPQLGNVPVTRARRRARRAAWAMLITGLAGEFLPGGVGLVSKLALLGIVFATVHRGGDA